MGNGFDEATQGMAAEDAKKHQDKAMNPGAELKGPGGGGPEADAALEKTDSMPAVTPELAALKAGADMAKKHKESQKEEPKQEQQEQKTPSLGM